MTDIINKFKIIKDYAFYDRSLNTPSELPVYSKYSRYNIRLRRCPLSPHQSTCKSFCWWAAPTEPIYYLLSW